MTKWKISVLTSLLLASPAFANGNGASFRCEFQQLGPGEGERVTASEGGVFEIDASGHSRGLKLVVDGNEASLYTVPAGHIRILLQPVGSSIERGFLAELPKEMIKLPEFSYSIYGNSKDFRLLCLRNGTEGLGL